MSDEGTQLVRQKSTLTEFMVALWKMTPEQRLKASADKAAQRYGIPVEWARFNIEEARKCHDVWPIRR